jgi:DNA-binding NarL/FixJ family response regulator
MTTGKCVDRGNNMSLQNSRDRINVIVVDDSELVAQSLERILRGESDIDVVGVAHSEEEALAVAAAHQVDVVVMDYRLGDTDGITAADHIRELRPGVCTLILTGDLADSYMMSRAREAGCAAVLAKTSGIHGSLAGTVRDAHAGTLQLPDPSLGVRISP